MTNSKKMQNYVINGDGLVTVKNNRWFNVCRDIETGIYILSAGREMMPYDYREEHETIESLEKSMREIANLRHWVGATY